MNTGVVCIALAVAAAAVPGGAAASEPAAARVLRAGIIGLDTSHVIAFTKLLNDPKATGDLAGVQVVAAYPGGSDIPASKDRVAGFTRRVRDMGVEIVESIPALLERVDVVLLESVDGNVHLKQAEAVFAAGKPVFIDKPLAASLADAVRIAELGRKHKVPWFSSSSLRFSPGILSLRGGSDKTGEVLGCDAWSPCALERSHPDLFWYGVHGVEALFTIMGPGCEKVSCARTDGAHLATGVWADGRIGTYRGIRKGRSGYGATVFGSKAIVPAGTYAGYRPLVEAIAKFFRTGRPPVAPEETLEMFAFMTAAQESLRRGGAAVTIREVMQQARQAASAPARAPGAYAEAPGAPGPPCASGAWSQRSRKSKASTCMGASNLCPPS